MAKPDQNPPKSQPKNAKPIKATKQMNEAQMDGYLSVQEADALREAAKGTTED